MRPTSMRHRLLKNSSLSAAALDLFGSYGGVLLDLTPVGGHTRVSDVSAD
jgi:hypothetical protein